MVAAHTTERIWPVPTTSAGFVLAVGCDRGPHFVTLLRPSAAIQRPRKPDSEPGPRAHFLHSYCHASVLSSMDCVTNRTHTRWRQHGSRRSGSHGPDDQA